MATFPGVPFDRVNPYSQAQAEALIPPLMLEMRRLLAASPALSHIVDTQSSKRLTGAWDVIPLRFGSGEAVTANPHFTVSLEPEWALIQITLPNAADKDYWHRLTRCSDEQLVSALRHAADVINSMHGNLAYGQWEPRLWIRLVQRHFHAQTFEVLDGRLEFDVDSLALWPGEPRVKPVVAWLPALRGLLRAKGAANYQFQVQARFPYGQGSQARSSQLPKALVACAEAFLPILKLLTGADAPEAVRW